MKRELTIEEKKKIEAAQAAYDQFKRNMIDDQISLIFDKSLPIFDKLHVSIVATSDSTDIPPKGYHEVAEGIYTFTINTDGCKTFVYEDSDKISYDASFDGKAEQLSALKSDISSIVGLVRVGYIGYVTVPLYTNHSIFERIENGEIDAKKDDAQEQSNGRGIVV